MPKFLWTLKQDMGPKPRRGHAMTFDVQRKRVILFGGLSIRSELLNDTWEWDGENWTQVSDMGPGPRCEFGMVSDSKRQKVVLFGGNAGNRQKFGDTWEWDGENWTQVDDSGPAPRLGSGMAFNSARNRVILFGGETAAGLAGDTWEWDGEQWTQLEETGPAARKGHGLVYASAQDRVILFGGEGDGAIFGDTWGWDGATWTQVSSLGPGPLTHAAMVHAIDRSALFGGFGFINDPPAPAVFGNTWSWDGKHWTRRQDFGPPPRWGHAMAFDSVRQRIVLFGGQPIFDPAADLMLTDRLMGDTWEHSVTPSPAAPDLPGPAEPAQPGSLDALVLAPEALIIPGVVAAGDQGPLHVTCTVRLNSAVPEVRNGIIVANLPVQLFRQFSIPAAADSIAVDLAVPRETPPGTYQITANLEGITRTAELTISVGA